MEQDVDEKNNVLISWEVPEFVKHERSTRWYIVACIVGVALILYAMFTANFLFAIIVVMAGIITFITSQKTPEKIPFTIANSGIIVGEHYHPYHEFKKFSILYNPPQVKFLYLDFDKYLRPTMKISLEDTDPNIVRDILLKFIQEDLSHVEESLTEVIARRYKL